MRIYLNSARGYYINIDWLIYGYLNNHPLNMPNFLKSKIYILQICYIEGTDKGIAMNNS
jgi:hypothetical protein